MEVLSLALYLGELALVGIVLYYLIGAIQGMPDWARTVAQALLILIFVIAAVHATIGGGPRRVPALSPIPPGPASIMR